MHTEMVRAVLPHTKNNKTSSYKLWYNKTPHCSWIRPFGCLCYAKLLTPRGKMDDTSCRCIHLGRSRTQPGYLCYEVETGRVFVNPHVRFVEDCFPGLTKVKGTTKIVPDFADDFDPDARRVTTDGITMAEDDDAEYSEGHFRVHKTKTTFSSL